MLATEAQGMTNREKLRELFCEIFLLEDEEATYEAILPVEVTG